ncbi:MAG: DMT family transporter [Anaerolineales bacterium]|nr:DMT family transporter [Anaerolineales bacterium]MCX7607868.1 DMT family transporter [Anaerolineales bacterium]MDW8226462.1 DMT family transporter [Anaerolineales bacterium]
MTLPALFLVSLSAFTHALWNFLSKRRNPPAAFFLMATAASAVILSPLLFVFRAGLLVIPPVVWALLAATGAVQAAYYISLAAAYRTGELSLAYPLARSLPVVLVALLSAVLGRGEQITALAYLGFSLVTIGCLLLPHPDFSHLHPRYYRHRWVLFALLAAVGVTAYTLLDDQALRILRSLPDTPLSPFGWALLFAELESLSITGFMTVFLLGCERERQALFRAQKTDWGEAAVMGVVILLTYGLVLTAMAYVRDVSYVSAFRQLSIPIGAALGILLRKESAAWPKLVGIGLVMIGLTLTALG